MNLFWFRILTKNALQKLQNLAQFLDKLVLKRQFWLRFFPRTRFSSATISLVAIILSFFIVLVTQSMQNVTVFQPKNKANFQKTAYFSHAFATKPSNLDQVVHFDSNSQPCVVDNCANCHIWNDKSLFLPETLHEPPPNTAVSTVSEEPTQAMLVGDVKLSWFCDEGKRYTIILNDCLYMPTSQVNILSCPALAEQLNDD